ncbi:MAG: uroporphyrinogen-III C-methyltransferase [Vicinamibacterales bacterium]
MRSTVYLIGAGPGAPDLITLRGYRCLQKADVVIYDHLVNPHLLEWAPASAERIDVGNAAPQQSDQEAICYLLAEKAREGKRVARLKWGDPFLFDQGGEEALFLHEQGIRFEVIPGVPAAIGASAHAGIPITYPGSGDTVILVRINEDDGRARIDWKSLAVVDGTIVFYTGPKQLPKMIDALLANGRTPGESAAVIVNGTLATQRTTTASLGELKQAMRDHPINGPALLVVGRVVGFREHLRWFDARPLFGRSVMVMRAHEHADDLIDLLEGQGATVIVESETPLDIYGMLLERKIDLVTFASAAAILEFAAKYGADQVADLLSHTAVAIVGPAAHDAAARANLAPAIHLPEGTTAAFVEAIASHFRSA